MSRESVFRKHGEVLMALLLVLVNFLIKGIYLSDNSLSGDEPFSVYHAQMDIASIIGELWRGNNPPLYEILLHLWIQVFGISEFSVRFPSLIFSGVTVFFMYRLGYRYLNKRVALYASLLFIFSNYHILFAHEARVYAFIGMLSLMSMYYFMGVLKVCLPGGEGEELASYRPKVRGPLIALILTNTLLIYSHYFGFFILITQFLFLAFHKELVIKYWKQILLSCAVIALLFLPNIVVVLERFMDSSSKGTWVQPPNGIKSIYNMLWKFSNAPVVTILVIGVFFSALVKALIQRKKEKKSLPNRLIAFWFVFVFFFMFAISYKVPMFMDRYLMPAGIAFSLLLAVAIDYLVKAPRFKYVIPVIVGGLFIATTDPAKVYQRDVEQTVEHLKERKQEKTLVLICPSHFLLNFAYYYDIEGFKNYSTGDIYANISKTYKTEHIYGVNNISEVDYTLYDHILYLDAAANFSYPSNNIRLELDAHYHLVKESHFYEIFKVVEYSAK